MTAQTFNQAEPSCPALSITLPLRTCSELNQRDKWGRVKRFKSQRQVVALALRASGCRPESIARPVVVRFVRLARRRLDGDDGLTSAMKAIRDEVCQWLGIDDGDRDAVSFAYEQERHPKPKSWAVRIEVYERAQVVTQIVEVA